MPLRKLTYLRSVFILLCSVLSYMAMGQNPALKKITRKQTNEVFYVLQSDTSVRHGAYQLLMPKRKTVVKGQYNSGRKSGIWESYEEDGSLRMSYDYDTDKFIACHIKKEDNRTYRLAQSLSLLDTSISQKPVSLWPDTYIYSFLSKNLRYPEAAVEYGMGGKVLVSFVVDSYGHPGQFEVKNPIGFGMDEEAIRVLLLLPDLWLPGMVKDIPTAMEVTMPLTFRIE